MLEPISRCPFCSLAYEKECVAPLSRADHREVIHASCFGCHRAMLFAIERREEHVSCVGVFTDCDQVDARRFLEKPKISLDDVLRAHEILSGKSS